MHCVFRIDSTTRCSPIQQSTIWLQFRRSSSSSRHQAIAQQQQQQPSPSLFIRNYTVCTSRQPVRGDKPDILDSLLDNASALTRSRAQPTAALLANHCQRCLRISGASFTLATQRSVRDYRRRNFASAYQQRKYSASRKPPHWSTSQSHSLET